ncbi:hypothetical protein Q5P01_008921 [Channa striata]|uniref:Uncharacterized protein n=1 Tax=Channa striata TaxID=64152 RepID=A0AA88N0H1_CHASR|nr:hypothetical protein Q5P01_008921 [Channa striata]
MNIDSGIRETTPLVSDWLFVPPERRRTSSGIPTSAWPAELTTLLAANSRRTETTHTPQGLQQLKHKTSKSKKKGG